VSFVYIASPYTHEDPAVMQERFEAVEKVTAELLKDGVQCYSPIVHCHVLAQKYDLPIHYMFWRDCNFAMLSKASKLFVLQLKGWEESPGVAGEMGFAAECCIPTYVGEVYA